jgi:cysteine desulfurase/selenocysteine lyase
MAVEPALSALTPGAFSGAVLRSDFAVFDRPTRSGKRLVFLDAAASAPKPRSVVEAMADAYSHHYANVHRGIYELSEDATGRFEGARGKVAAFIGAPSKREIVFVRNATEAINLVAFSWGRANVHSGDRVVTTQLEHHANIVPWQQLTAEVGATLDYVAITDDGRLDLDDMRAKLAKGPKLLAVAAVSNALGTINPLPEIIRMAHEAGALVLVDAAQAAPHMPIDVTALDCDFLALSGHKMLGPSGIGALWGRRELLDAMPPFMTGGSMIIKVTMEGAEWNEVPYKFEAGTPAIVEAIGLGAAIDYVGSIGKGRIRAHETELVKYASDRLREINSLRIIGNAKDKGAIVSFEMKGAHPHDIATIIDRSGVAVRAGTHCVMPLLARFGVTATCRASFALYNTKAEVDRLAEALIKAQQFFA